MAQHPWVAAASDGIRWGVQLITPNEPNALNNLIQTAQTVEDLGYDFLSIFDHPLMHVDPWIALSGIATRTSRVRLGSTVNCAAYRHPAYVARLATDLDNLSNGRHVLGLGSGWLKPEFAALGLEFLVFAAIAPNFATAGNFFEVIRLSDYNGWIVLEAEQDPAKANPLEYAIMARNFFRGITGI